MTRIGLLLAAGHSVRFGPQDKLLSAYSGQPLVTHAAHAMRQCGLDHLVASVSNAQVGELLPGFILTGPSGDRPDQSASLRAGLAACQALDPARRPDESDDELRVLLVLGDMPHVTADHLKKLLQTCTDDTGAASSDGSHRSPPACFPGRHLDQLLKSQGDRGARDYLRALPSQALVMCDAAMLRDIDVPADLA